jgi:hypothetical protein
LTDPAATLDLLAAACAEGLPRAPQSFAQHRRARPNELEALVSAVRDTGEPFAFDAEGRPAAVAAVRSALPTGEAELLDAVLDDVACELAAWQEALYRVAVASRGAAG